MTNEILTKKGTQLEEAQLALNNANWLIGDQANKNDKLVASLNQQLDEAQKQVAQLREALFGVLCRLREREPSLFDNPDHTDLGEAIAKAKTIYEQD